MFNKEDETMQSTRHNSDCPTPAVFPPLWKAEASGMPVNGSSWSYLEGLVLAYTASDMP